jgi:DNA-binding transcriptional MerR regulator
MAGVSLRTLRHYDQIGLLHPTGRSEAGYRLYGERDLLRLQQILMFRELDFPLKNIKKILDDPGFDTLAALKKHADVLRERSERCAKLSRLAAETIEYLKGEKTMKEEQLFNGFDYDKMMKEQEGYEEEVKERWGDTDAYRISKERAARYSKEDWARISQAQQDNLNELCSLYAAGVPAQDSRVQKVVRDAKDIIDKNFYPCSAQMMSCLGSMYVTDPRFTAYYDKHAPGLAAFYNDAIQYFCREKA